MKISCEIIKDLLPLYYDKVCSNASRVMIEEHLTSCKDCEAELLAMDNELLFNGTGHNQMEQNLREAKAVEKISKKWKVGMRKSNLKGVLFTILITLIIALILYCLMDIRVTPKF